MYAGSGPRGAPGTLSQNQYSIKSAPLCSDSMLKKYAVYKIAEMKSDLTLKQMLNTGVNQLARSRRDNCYKKGKSSKIS